MRKFVMALLLIGLCLPGPAFAQADSGQGAVYEQLNLFGEAFERIREDAVDPVPDKRLVNTAIAGMLSSLDPHSLYISESDYKSLSATDPQTAGSIGLVATIKQGDLTVISPRDGSPAAKAGLKPGDVIFTIDQSPTYEMTLAEAEQMLRGPVGSEVSLVVRRGDHDVLTFKMKRAKLTLPTVTGQIEDGNVGYIRIAGFDNGTATAVGGTAQQLQQQAGGKLVGFVIDLRNNPGGKFKAAIATADDFLQKGDVTIIKGRTKQDDKRIAATPGDVTHGMPIVVLINGGTASEAELVAAALQDNHRAELLGTKTFGESAIESIIPLPGNNGAIQLTTARFLTPDGQAIDGKGLTPDLTVKPLTVEKLAELEQIREANLRGALKNPDVTPKPEPAPVKSPSANVPAGTTPAKTPKATSASVSNREIGRQNDEQLAQAIDVLQGLAIVSERGAR